MNNKKPDRKTFYITAAICAAALTVTGFIAANGIRSGMGKVQYKVEMQTPAPTSTPEAARAAAPKTDIPKEIPKTAKNTSAKPVQARQTAPVEFIIPSEGKLIRNYSAEALIYSPTFDDWRAHSGIDIEADEDSQVKAAADGKISDAYFDEMMGNTIEIDHGGELVTRYSGLANTELVKEGSAVKQGDVIGGVGNTAAAENTQPPHLHFEVIYKNSPIDPLSKLKGDILMPNAEN